MTRCRLLKDWLDYQSKVVSDYEKKTGVDVITGIKKVSK